MRILHLINGLGGGGAERQLSYLAPKLVKFGAEVHVAHVSKGVNLHRLQESGCVLHRIPSKGNYDPGMYIAVSRLIKRLQPEIVQTWLTQMNVLGGYAAARHRIPHVLSERTSATAFKRGWKTVIRKAVGRRAAAIVANSMHGLEYWDSIGDGVLKVTIPNGVPIQELEDFQRKEIGSRKSASCEDLLLFAGRYLPVKNVELTMASVIEIARQRENVVGRFFGDGPLDGRLRRAVADANLGDRITVSSYSDRIWQWLADADAFISLSDYEGQPNTVLEAAVIGCPLVLSDIPAHREIFTGEAVKYVNELAVEEIVKKVLAVLDDRDAARSRAALARNIAMNYSFDMCARRYLDLYEELAT